MGRFDAPADAVMTTFFRAHPAMGQRDRAFIAEGAYAYLRRKRSLDALAATGDPHKLALSALVRDLGYSVRELQSALDDDDASWLADFKQRAQTTLSPAIVADLPDWLWDRLRAAYGDTEALALARAFQTPAPFDLRVNPLKTTRDAAITALRDGGLDARPTPFAPLGIRVAGRPSLVKHPCLVDGRMEVQDEGSQLIGHLVAPRRSDMVVDFCAGAGGKTLLLGALMRSHGRLYAFDVNAKRLAQLTPRLARSGLSNVHPQVLAHESDARIKRLAGKVDRVLVDAPCSGFGTLRRNPDLKWRQTPADLDELVAKQARIIASAATLVKPGGRLVYATCSVLPDENDAIVDAFLGAHTGFVQRDATTELAKSGIRLDTGERLRVTPSRHGCDGFFAAILERSSQP